jgi:hypothetical protein
MTVGDLRIKLAKLPADCPVFVRVDGAEVPAGAPAEHVAHGRRAAGPNRGQAIVVIFGKAEE